MFASIQHFEVWELFCNRLFWCGFGSWLVATAIKVAICCCATRKLDFSYFVSTGGMPSCHSATVCGLAMGIGYTKGFSSAVCVLAAAFAIVTMFDAATVRHAAGEHAKVLNAIVSDIRELKLKPRERLKELLGHTRTEVVCGMAVGVAWATFLCWIFD